jgi:hypothetical protein
LSRLVKSKPKGKGQMANGKGDVHRSIVRPINGFTVRPITRLADHPMTT